jgi:hypothetical protein
VANIDVQDHDVLILDIYVAYLRAGFVGVLGCLRSGDPALFAYFRQDRPFDAQIVKYLFCLLVAEGGHVQRSEQALPP